MCVWASSLILLRGLSWDPRTQLFDVLTEWTVFGGSIFYFSAVVALFILRRQRPDAVRPYRTWGYPVVPAVFLVFYVFLMASMYWARPVERTIGVAIIASGGVAYFFWGERARREIPPIAEASPP